MTADPCLPAALWSAVRAVRVNGTVTEAELPDRRVAAEDARQLTGLLADALYATLHAGLPDSDAPPHRLRDPQLEEALAREAPHTSFPLDAELIDRQPAASGADDLAVVRTNGVAVTVPGALLTGPAEPGQRTTLAWPAAHPAVSPGFFFVTGSQGPPPGGRPLLRVYLHLRDADTAPALFGQVLRTLEAAGRPYRAKAGSTPLQYPRRDALVVYVSAEDHALVDLVAREVRGHPALGEETSLFARRHAPGVASAAEPEDSRPGMRGMSFGQHRSHVVAQALVEHAEAGHAGDLDVLLARRLAEASVDPADPARNLTARTPEADLSRI
ncbi:T3SS effector HopA1 family protein [Streptomyces sp. NPDC046727]|uniref:T3SS effector HopA1 family protein n=1 Tax=Streptomyces sp. NPDC046727 TaxID=3155373 RepID=UPI0033F99496